MTRNIAGNRAQNTMSEKVGDTERRRATRAEMQWFLEERAERHEDQEVKRNADLDRIAEQSRTERANQIDIETDTAKILDENQGRIVTELEEAAEEWRDFLMKIDFKDSENLAHFETANVAYEKAIVKAIRADLLRHRLVRAWISVQRNFGERDLLRTYSKRHSLDTGVNRTKNKLDVWIAFHASPLVANGKKSEAIRRILVNSLLDPKSDEWLGLTAEELKGYRSHLRRMSRQAFHKRLRHLQVIDVVD